MNAEYKYQPTRQKKTGKESETEKSDVSSKWFCC